MTSPDVIRLAGEHDERAALLRDVADGLRATPRALPPKWLYDARGSELFEEITRQPEYYQTRVEAGLLEEYADELVKDTEPEELVEIGSGSSRKTRLLLEAMLRHGSGATYVGLDVSEDAVVQAARTLEADYPELRVQAVVGDFDRHLDEVPRGGRRLVVLLGSTIGNMHPDEQVDFLRNLRTMLANGDALLLGFDLVKDADTLRTAYDDAAGVTRAFTANLLQVLRRELDADVDVTAFEPFARWEPEPAWVELGLRAVRDTSIHVPDLDLRVTFPAGAELRTELSCKYTLDSARQRLAAAGLALVDWRTDDRSWFALGLARPA